MIDLLLLQKRLQENTPIAAGNVRLARSLEETYPKGVLSAESREDAVFVDVGYYRTHAPSVSLEEPLSNCVGVDTTINVSYTVILYAPSKDFLWLWKRVYNALNGWEIESSDPNVSHNTMQYYQGNIISLNNGIYKWIDEWRLDVFEVNPEEPSTEAPQP